MNPSSVWDPVILMEGSMLLKKQQYIEKKPGPGCSKVSENFDFSFVTFW